MLDSETRRRIDTARDILVGKVPDPKSQVEQITIALIYKFMDDMDRQSVEMGGKPGFFKAEFEKYRWSNIFNPRLGGIEMLALYGEAITRMSQNANLPQLFRDIFKNAFLPYRDPETLKLFLKTINEFSYDHSEKLGDAFEYLLSVLGAQGDAGQFRTPRHIIDFMVQVIAPKKTETVLDPACGTAGFLVSAYKYILKTSQESGKPLTTQEKQRLYDNFMGYDISPDMVRLSLVNLYLHGFVKPHIYEYDTLTTEERWSQDYADVILANPPFMSPKGGIQPHKRFSVQSNRSEVLFVDYMAEHLTPNGRAAIIVPEGIIFQSAGAYKQLRKYLVEHNYLWAVVSLPAGVFNPYAGVKTSILFLDKAFAKKTDQILFVKVERDGYDLGAQRRALCNDVGDKPELCSKHSDLPDALNTLHVWHKAVQDGNTASFRPTIGSALLVPTSRLVENDEYNLSADRYREVTRVGKQKYLMVTLGEVIDLNFGIRITKRENQGTVYPVYGGGGESFRTDTFNRENELVISRFAMSENCVRYVTGKFYLLDSGFTYSIKNQKKESLDKGFVDQLLLAIQPTIYRCGRGHAQRNLDVDQFKSIQIPLPPPEIQRQIVDEIAAYQCIIDGAHQVVERWKPNLELELVEFLPQGDKEFPQYVLGDIAELEYGFTASAEETGDTRFIRITDINDDGTLIPETAKYINLTEENKSYLLQEGDLLVARTGATYGKTLHFENGMPALFASYLIRIRFNKDVSVLPKYYWYFARSEEYWRQAKSLVTGGGQPQFNGNALKQISLPVPPPEVQREIVARIERERSIVESNRELIRIYEEKVKRIIERVWEG